MKTLFLDAAAAGAAAGAAAAASAAAIVFTTAIAVVATSAAAEAAAAAPAAAASKKSVFTCLHIRTSWVGKNCAMQELDESQLNLFVFTSHIMSFTYGQDAKYAS